MLGERSSDFRRVIVRVVLRIIRSCHTTHVSGFADFENSLVDTIEMIEAFDVLSKRFGSETCTHGVEKWIGVGFGVIHVLSSHRSTHILVGQECCEKYKSSAPAGSAEVQQHSHRH